MRYYALYSNAGWVVFDNCVDKGQGAVRIGMVQEQRHAQQICEALNEKDGEAKAAFDAAAPTDTKGADDSALFTMDVVTHAQRYFIGPGGLHVTGTSQAIDALRVKLNGRYQRVLDLQQALTRTRGHLKDAQQAADKYKALTNALQDEVDRLRKLYHADSGTYRVELQTSVAYETGRELASRVRNQIGLIEQLHEQLHEAKVARDLAVSNPQIMPARCENLVRAAIETLQRALPVTYGKTENCDTQGT